MLLGTKPSVTEGYCEIAGYTKGFVWNNQFYVNSPLLPANAMFPSARKPGSLGDMQVIEAVL